jgi:hypothetical protein
MEEKISTLNDEKTSAVITSRENISAFQSHEGLELTLARTSGISKRTPFLSSERAPHTTTRP